MGVDPKTRKKHMTRYRAKPGVRTAELSYQRNYGKLLYATPEGRAYQLFKGARLRAKQRELDFDLNVEFVLERINHGFCPVLGLPFDLSPSSETHHNPLAPSIDRTDSSKGYVKSNVQIVSVWWNTAKGQWTEEFNKVALRRAVEYFELKRFPWE